VPTIHFVNGPCDGTTRNITQAELNRGSVTCQGVVYLRVKASSSLTGGEIVFDVASIVRAEQANNRAFDTHAVTEAYRRVARALAHTAPQQVRRLEAQTRRLRRIAR
jgi:hypothetical protein